MTCPANGLICPNRQTHILADWMRTSNFGYTKRGLGSALQLRFLESTKS